MAQANLKLGAVEKIVIAGKANAKFEYADGKRTDKPVTNEKGAPLYSYEVASENLGQARLVCSKNNLVFGSVVDVPENASVSVRATSENNFAKVIYTFTLG